MTNLNDLANNLADILLSNEDKEKIKESNKQHLLDLLTLFGLDNQDEISLSKTDLINKKDELILINIKHNLRNQKILEKW